MFSKTEHRAGHECRFDDATLLWEIALDAAEFDQSYATRVMTRKEWALWTAEEALKPVASGRIKARPPKPKSPSRREIVEYLCRAAEQWAAVLCATTPKKSWAKVLRGVETSLADALVATAPPDPTKKAVHAKLASRVEETLARLRPGLTKRERYRVAVRIGEIMGTEAPPFAARVKHMSDDDRRFMKMLMRKRRRSRPASIPRFIRVQSG